MAVDPFDAIADEASSTLVSVGEGPYQLSV